MRGDVVIKRIKPHDAQNLRTELYKGRYIISEVYIYLPGAASPYHLTTYQTLALD